MRSPTLALALSLLLARSQGGGTAIERRLQSVQSEARTLCDDSCTSHADNRLCEDGGPGSVWPDCPLGTDCTDCGVRYFSRHVHPPPSVPPLSPRPGCNETCPSAGNGLCEDGGPGSVWPDCPLGTDCTDCGMRAETSGLSRSPPPPSRKPVVTTSPDGASSLQWHHVFLMCAFLIACACACMRAHRGSAFKGLFHAIFNPTARPVFNSEIQMHPSRGISAASSTWTENNSVTSSPL
jgi:hypothetical protein